MSKVKIIHVSADDIRKMTDTEGLVLQGCDGDAAEWADGINNLLTAASILLDGDTFKDAFVFEHEGHTNILFGMENVKLDITKLAMWRLQSHRIYGGTWLSDYLPNHLGVHTQIVEAAPAKPKMMLSGMDGNIFGLLGTAAELLKRNGQKDAANEMLDRAEAAQSYDETLQIVSEYVQTELSDVRTPIERPLTPKGYEPKLVYICAPLRGDVERNVEVARLFAKEVFERGDIPVCPHLMFPPIAAPKDTAQDAKVLAMCMKLIERCHQVNVYGALTEGMQTEIDHAKQMRVPVLEAAPAKKKAPGKASKNPSR